MASDNSIVSCLVFTKKFKEARGATCGASTSRKVLTGSAHPVRKHATAVCVFGMEFGVFWWFVAMRSFLPPCEAISFSYSYCYCYS